jgi:hypothetical protein
VNGGDATAVEFGALGYIAVGEGGTTQPGEDLVGEDAQHRAA